MTQIVNLPTLTTSTTTNIVVPIADLNTNPGITKKISLDNLVSLARGNPGPQGVPGPLGVRGFTGSAGVGYTGSASTIVGYTGSSGYAGSKGYAGSVGSTGTVGYTGSTGPGADQQLNTTSSVRFNSVSFTDGTTQTTALIKGVVVLNNLTIGDYDISGSRLTGNILVTPTNMGANRKLNLPAPIVASGNVITIRNRDLTNTLDLRYNGFNGIGITTVAAGSSILLACDNSTWFLQSSGGGGGNGYTGSAGYDGSTGYWGSRGFVGSVGYTGSAGIGYTGSASTVVGYTGSTGAGFIGSAGYVGSKGFVGSSGFVGSQGYAGSAGAGFTGSAGTAGFTGSAGSGGGTAYNQNLMTTSSVTFSNVTVTNTLTAATLLIGQSGVGTVQSGNDLALKAAGNITTNAPFVLNVYTTSTLAAIAGPSIGSMVFLTNAPGGSQPVYYDGTHWYTVNARTQVI